MKFDPPKPKALTAALRAPEAAAGHSRSSVLTLNGECAQSILGFGSRKFRLGGSTFSCSAMAALNSPAAPAAALRWPMLDLTEPSGMEPGAAPAGTKTLCSASASLRSPTRVDVPCASMRPTAAGSRPDRRHARSIARRCPTGFGAVMPLPLPSLEAPKASSTA